MRDTVLGLEVLDDLTVPLKRLLREDLQPRVEWSSGLVFEVGDHRRRHIFGSFWHVGRPRWVSGFGFRWCFVPSVVIKTVRTHSVRFATIA